MKQGQVAAVRAFLFAFPLPARCIYSIEAVIALFSPSTRESKLLRQTRLNSKRKGIRWWWFEVRARCGGGKSLNKASGKGC